MTGYPLLLDVTGRTVLVAGGGPVAARRVEALLAAGADVVVVAPYAVEALRDLAAAGRLRWERRDYATADLAGCWLVQAATGDRSVNAAISADADAAGVWCVRADDAGSSAAHTPAVARSGDVTVAVSAGGDPQRAATLRDAIRLLLETGTLPVRRRRPPRAGLTGRVALVGSGPGDPGLVTVRGRQLLAEADVVVVDRLAARDVLDLLDDDVEVVDAGKAPHAHTMTQDEINDVLVERARAGLRVVRLKGGDPFVLGRGGEEALACVSAGVPVEVVPGVTSAVAVPAAAGIPVTHRRVSEAFTVVSAHLDPLRPEQPTTDWAAIARTPGTLCVLMGMGRLEQIAAALVAGGRGADTPAAVVTDGTTPCQRVVTATLATVAEASRRAGLRPPGVLVVGDVVSLREALLAGQP